ncbi:MAG: hypothetical protein RL632_1698 [Bacteroidota bacterium]
MKAYFLLLFLSISCTSIAQIIGGTLVDDGRKMTSTTNFFVTDSLYAGTVVMNLSVNRKGEVTSGKAISEGTTIQSTPVRIKVRNAAMKLKFEESIYYPEFHIVTVKFTVKKP